MHDEYRKLRQWLHLEPDGPWPPSTADLLGLTPAEAAAPQTLGWTVLEARVLERMDWLRPYQLKYPELVTEGMNRLAQALLEALAPPQPSPAPPRPRPPPPPPPRGAGGDPVFQCHHGLSAFFPHSGPSDLFQSISMPPRL
ncbi:MAG: hypothetical protein NZ703_07960 [Gemmataceae bacterium]|nr:hypothetical protein [Gemmataceae bacterium]